MTADFLTVRTIGGLLPPDLLARVLSGDGELGGLRPADYHLAPGETPREAANRAWSYLTGVWASYRAAVDKLPAGDAAIGLTRSSWLLVLLRELGYGQVPATGAGGIDVDGTSYPISHVWGASPMHLLGWGVDLDKRTKGVPGAAGRAPHAMLQELLNRTDGKLWGVISNGRLLRLLRDSTSLSGQAFVEFDLEAMFDGEVFSDFVLLYLLAHQSRVEVPEGSGPADCWLEKWRNAATESGTRALGLLRDGVKQALEELGTGFLTANPSANASLVDGSLRLDDLHQALLRLVYRLLFLFVAEDRDALLDRDASTMAARGRYIEYFSTQRLRRLARTRRGTRHGDLWQSMKLVIEALGEEGGEPALALPGIGGLFEAGEHDVVMAWELPNSALLAAVRNLTVVHPKGQPRRVVDYRNLGAEELGSIYESLLELVPRHDSVMREFRLAELAGNDRKTSGSYYTPTALIDLVLDEALDPLLDDAERSEDAESALLAVTVCDPACGSGHFLVAAGRRIATRLAAVRTRESDPTPTAIQDAMHDVVSRCLYGVDLNPMAADLAKVSLWLEAMAPGRPLSFLDAHIKVGNALLGTTPALLAAGIPDAAFDAIEGDDKRYAAALKKRNRNEREAQQGAQADLFDVAALEVGNRALQVGYAEIDGHAHSALSLADIHLARSRYRDLVHSTEARRALALADTWCAAFVQPKEPGQPAITHDALTARSPEVEASVERLAAEYRFFHWHLEFPDIFRVPDGGPAVDTENGWRGGFSAVVGNPPWERVKLQEQEFFASRDESIANAGSAATRKSMIARLSTDQPNLWAEWQAAKRRSDGEGHLLRSSNRFPLCGRGDVNTYSVFAEHFRSSTAQRGRMGIVTPTGLATDATTAAFFADTLRRSRLAAFYDFENEAKIFAGVHNQFRFAVTCMTGGLPADLTQLAFYTRRVEDVPARKFTLSSAEILLLNPNTGTLPVFRSRQDAEITLGVYRRHAVIQMDPEAGPWGLDFRAGLVTADGSSAMMRSATDFEPPLDAGDWMVERDGDRWVPVYEAKMLGVFDHRLSTYSRATQAQLNKGTLPRTTDTEKDDPGFEAQPRSWLPWSRLPEAVRTTLERQHTLLGWRKIGRASDARTFMPLLFPSTPVLDNVLLAHPSREQDLVSILGLWSSYVFDYLVRQKAAGANLQFYLLKQIAMPSPDDMSKPVAWLGGDTVHDWMLPRILELTYTSERMRPFAQAFGDDSEPFRWMPDRRELLQAEIDACAFHVYGLTRSEVDHVLDSFFVVRKYEERDHGEFRTKRLVLDRFDAMAYAALIGGRYEPVIAPAPGLGPRHGGP